ncbi:MAG: adenosylmethionine--8-amino-7-oxononanoate transaminase [bacterium]|nr:adenosylmethionine--8-amino-7-oxononanoate transaminase [bacterium]
MSDYHRIDRDHIWHPFTPMRGQDSPVLIEKAKGTYLYTEKGDKILDAVSSWWVSIHGHGNEHIAKAVAQQALDMEHVIFAGFTHKPAIQLAKNVLSILPENQQKVFFSDNGSTSVEVALKMAFQFWHNQGIERKKVIAIDGAYHGDTFGSMSVGERGSFNIPFEPFLFDVEFIPLPNEENWEGVKAQFSDLIASGNVASFIFEPLVQGSAGMRMYKAEHLQELVSVAQSNDVICIADEVMTGFGRTGKMFSTDHIESNPDIFCLSKGLTGGTMPMGLTTASSKIVSAFDTDDIYKTFFHGHSYTGNPIACAAANASFELITKPEFQENLDRINEQHRTFMEEIESHSKIKNVRLQGTIIALELDLGTTSYMNKSRNRIYGFFMDKGILMRPLGNVIYILPPSIISNEELESIYGGIRELLETI